MAKTRLIAICLLASLLGGLPAQASGSFPWFPWYPLADNPGLGDLAGIPECTDGGVSAKLLDRFNRVEFVYWGNFQHLQGVEGLSESGQRERGYDKIARRWCQGTAVFADGSRRHVVIEMASNAEWLGLTYSLSYCIVGLDRGSVYGRNCEGLSKRNF